MIEKAYIFRRRHRTRWGRFGFTLTELMVSMAVLSILLALIAQVMGQVQRAWSSASSRVSQFREARRAFDRITRNLSQATLNNYVQYVYANYVDPRVPPSSSLKSYPSGYSRYSELQFRCGSASEILGISAAQYPGKAVFFQAPLGTNSMDVNLPTALNPVGYFVQYGSDESFRPGFLDSLSPPLERRYRYRLMEFRAPAEYNRVYDQTQRTKQVTQGSQQLFWVTGDGTGDTPWTSWSRPVAENIALLVISPRLAVSDGTVSPESIAPDYRYDSSAKKLQVTQNVQDYQLPPMVEVIMVAIAESSAVLMAQGAGSGGQTNPPLDFQNYFSNANDSSKKQDLESLGQQLTRQRVNYRIFSSVVPIRNSKWNG